VLDFITLHSLELVTDGRFCTHLGQNSIEIVSQEEAFAKNEQELVISLGFLILENINLSCISHMLQVVIPYHNYD